MDLVEEDNQKLVESKTSIRESGKSASYINKCYLAGLLFTISIGTIQFGYSIGAWNTATNAYFAKFPPKDDDDKTNKQTLIQAITIFGSAIAALFGGPLLQFGRWKCILLTNILVIAGSVLCLFSNFGIFVFGRFLFGAAAGAFSLFCPKYLSEVAPVEYKGPIGTLTQISVTFGILLPFGLGLFFQDVKSYSVTKLSWFIYVVISIIPIGFSIIQIALMMTIYRFDTPVFLHQKGQHDRLRIMFGKIYHADFVQEKIDELETDKKQEDKGSVIIDENEAIGYKAVCFDKKYQRATYVGISIAIIQQLSGINVIMFYSNTVFSQTGSSLSATTITGIVGLINFLTTFVGLVLLTKFGRKKIFFWCNVAVTIIDFIVGISIIKQWGPGMIGGTFAFISFFEFGPGPITWLYMAEIMQDKAQGIATMMNWGINLMISLIIPSVINALIGEKLPKDQQSPGNVGYIFIFFAVTSFFGTVFIHFYMDETMGKTQEEIDNMFNRNPDYLELKQHKKQSTVEAYDDVTQPQGHNLE